MKMKNSVNILGHDYSVKLVPAAKIGPNVAGLTKFPSREILIAKELDKEMRFITLLHEIWHGVQFENGDMQILQHQSQEKACDQFASFIMSLKKQGVL